MGGRGSGGARPGSGPAPDVNAIRRGRVGEWVILPESGRRGHAPGWPLESRASTVERRLWRELWHTPQAVAWSALGMHRQVALYARQSLVCEQPDVPVARLGILQRMADTLGLTPAGLRMNRWRISNVATAEQRPPDPAPTEPDQPTTAQPSRAGSRERFRPTVVADTG